MGPKTGDRRNPDRPVADKVTLELLVKPRAKRESVELLADGRVAVAVMAPPVEGRANEAVVRALAGALGVPRSGVEILRGESGKRKVVAVLGLGAAECRRRLSAQMAAGQ